MVVRECDQQGLFHRALFPVVKASGASSAINTDPKADLWRLSVLSDFLSNSFIIKSLSLTRIENESSILQPWRGIERHLIQDLKILQTRLSFPNMVDLRLETTPTLESYPHNILLLRVQRVSTFANVGFLVECNSWLRGF
jgi:hypothetical protein